MDHVIDYEVEEINKIDERVINNAKIIVCMNSLIRIHIKQTESRQITVCLRFPSNYPSAHLLVELKSVTISGKFFAGLTTLAEQKAKEILGKPQSLHVLKVIDNYLNENPLCVAYDEIATIKTLLRQKGDSATGGGELKCLQKTSSISLTVNSNDYYYKLKLRIPDAYPAQCVLWLEHRTNFPVTLSRFLTGQAKEIARKCVEPPLRLANSQHKFEPRPSLQPTTKFLVEAVFDFPTELCPICDTACLPANANDIETCDTADRYVERVYCGHIYHLGCLRKYMREPPFPPGDKTCPAKKIYPRSDQDKESNQLQQIKKSSSAAASSSSSSSHFKKTSNMCGLRMAHDRWALNVKLAEARWAQQQARERELEEVKDFLQ